MVEENEIAEAASPEPAVDADLTSLEVEAPEVKVAKEVMAEEAIVEPVVEEAVQASEATHPALAGSVLCRRDAAH